MALKNVVWCLRGREGAITAQSKLFKIVLVGHSVALMTEDIQRLG